MKFSSAQENFALTNNFTRNCKCLDIINDGKNDGKNDKLIMANCKNGINLSSHFVIEFVILRA